MIAIINYEAGNVRSVQKAFEYIGADAKLTDDAEEILSAEAVVLPGVGAYKDCMESLGRKNLQNVVKSAALSGKPFLGICLGFQLLFEGSEEHADCEGGIVPGLGLYRGRVKKLQSDGTIKIPHMGWNKLCLKNQDKLYEGIGDGSYAYFVHSYRVDAKDRNIVSASSYHGLEFDSAISDGNVFGVQFHPEKSGGLGLNILKNFVKLIG